VRANGVLWLGRLMMANPILAVIGLIAAGALYIWQNWETLGPKLAALWDSFSSKVSAVWQTPQDCREEEGAVSKAG